MNQRRRAGDRGNVCVLEGCVRLPAFQHRRRQHIRSPTGSARANGRQPEPAGRRIRSSNPEFYLAHFDLTGKIGNIMTAVGASVLPILMDTFVRLTRSPVVSIAKIRGCVRGVSSEFVLACDMRFASRENTRLGQPEVGVGLHPGGGGAERLPHLVGRGRASKSFSARTTSTATPRNDTDTSTGHFQMPSWTASSTRSRAGSPPSTGVPSPRRRISSTRSRCRPPTGSSTLSPLLRPH